MGLAGGGQVIDPRMQLVDEVRERNRLVLRNMMFQMVFQFMAPL
jgi:hypothetical protein